MAYHYALPKQYIAAGKLEFVARAIDGAIPLLIHMTYTLALALGGELALTFWSMVTGWAVLALAYTTARRWLDRSWALSMVLLLATTPAIIFTGGTGHIEPRLALFALLAAVAASDAIHKDDLRFTLICACATGFFIGSKFTGLLFALSVGLILVGFMIQRRQKWFLNGSTLTAVAILVGIQWYIVNWIFTGDPVFPLFFGVLDYTNPDIWDASQHAAYQRFSERGEVEVPNNLSWLIAYPFVATFKGLPVFESGRTGFGPFFALAAPIIILAVGANRRKLLGHPLFPILLIAVLFYVFWFLSGVSQRSRHMIPIYPAVLICGMYAIAWWSNRHRSFVPVALCEIYRCGVQRHFPQTIFVAKLVGIRSGRLDQSKHSEGKQSLCAVSAPRLPIRYQGSLFSHHPRW